MSTDSDHVVWIWHAGRFWNNFKYLHKIFSCQTGCYDTCQFVLLLTLSEYGFWGLKEREDIEEIENR